MFIIDCLPFSKGLNKEMLSYFSATYLEPGALIKVNIRGKSVSALVLESRDAKEAKSEIKSADFQLKKISAFTGKPFLEREFLEAVQECATYFASTPGGILSQLIPSVVLENPNLFSHPAIPKPEKVEDIKKIKKAETAVLQTGDEDRLDHYRSLIREEFAKNKSVFLCLPQNEMVLPAKQKLERGIESFVFTFHSEMTKKNLKEEWKKLFETKHPVLIVGTAKWLFLPRNDLGTIVIDKENDSAWKTLSRPFIDLRFFAETLAKKKNIRCIIGDAFLRTETLYRHKQGEFLEFESVKWRLPPEVATTIVDLRETTKKTPESLKQGGEFRILSKELHNLIKDTTEKSSHLFIFVSRKGLAPTVICRDCGEPVKCLNCGAGMVLYKTKNGGAFRCHQCDETRDAAEFCQNCQSWKLSAYGISLDRVAEEIKKEAPEAKLFEINKDIANTNVKALKIVKDFYETRGSILLGTEIAFAYLYKKVTASSIASFDSLFSIPDFRIREKIFRLILQTRNLARESFLVQTRNTDDPTVISAVAGNILEFYKREMEDRKILEYPPYGLFVKVTTRGARNFVAREAENLKQLLPGATIFNSIHEKKGEQMAVNAILKLPKSDWPEAKLLSILKSLPSHFEIKVDPDSLL